MNKITFLVVFVIMSPIASAYVNIVPCTTTPCATTPCTNRVITFSSEDTSGEVEPADEDEFFDISTSTSASCNPEEFKHFRSFLKNMEEESKKAYKNKDKKLDNCSVHLYKVSFKGIKKARKNKELGMTYCGQAADYCKSERFSDRISLAIFEYENLDEKCSSFVDLGVSNSECSLIFF